MTPILTTEYEADSDHGRSQTLMEKVGKLETGDELDCELFRVRRPLTSSPDLVPRHVEVRTKISTVTSSDPHLLTAEEGFGRGRLITNVITLTKKLFA